MDALPGLYGPAAFLRHLGKAAGEARALAAVPDGEYPDRLAQYHRERLNAQTRELKDVSPPELWTVSDEATSMEELASPPTAAEASERTRSKSDVEMPLIRALLQNLGPAEMTSPQVSAELTALARYNTSDAHLDDASRRLLTKGGAWVGGEASPLQRFEEKIAEDTVRNEYLFHKQIHSWFAKADQIQDLATFNERVYAEIFLTPASDPWLGLGPSELYSVLTPAGK